MRILPLCLCNSQNLDIQFWVILPCFLGCLGFTLFLVWTLATSVFRLSVESWHWLGHFFYTHTYHFSADFSWIIFIKLNMTIHVGVDCFFLRLLLVTYISNPLEVFIAWLRLHWLLHCSISPLLVFLIQVLRLSSQSTRTNKDIILHENPKSLQDT